MNLQHIYQEFKYHLITIIVVGLILLAIVVNWLGSRSNKQLAERYRDIISPVLSTTFSEYKGELVEEAPNIMKLYPMGRNSCLFAIVSFALVPRQQLLSFLFNSILFGLKDELVVQIPINNQHPLSLTAAIVQKKQIRSITKKSFPDIKHLCKQYHPNMDVGSNKPTLPDTHSLLVEKIEHVRYFLASEKEVQTWKQYGKHVRLVYISDVNKFSRYPMAVRMVLTLHPTGIIPMLEWLVGFIDRVASIKMGAGERKEAQKKRQTLNINYQ